MLSEALLQEHPTHAVVKVTLSLEGGWNLSREAIHPKEIIPLLRSQNLPPVDFFPYSTLRNDYKVEMETSYRQVLLHMREDTKEIPFILPLFATFLSTIDKEVCCTTEVEDAVTFFTTYLSHPRLQKISGLFYTSDPPKLCFGKHSENPTVPVLLEKDSSILLYFGGAEVEIVPEGIIKGKSLTYQMPKGEISLLPLDEKRVDYLHDLFFHASNERRVKLLLQHEGPVKEVLDSLFISTLDSLVPGCLCLPSLYKTLYFLTKGEPVGKKELQQLMEKLCLYTSSPNNSPNEALKDNNVKKFLRNKEVEVLNDLDSPYYIYFTLKR